MFKPGSRKWAVAILAVIMCSFIPAGSIAAKGENTDRSTMINEEGQVNVPVSYQPSSHLLVTVKGTGSVTDGNLSVKNATVDYILDAGQTITLTLKPDDGSRIEKVTLNGKDVSSQIKENQISVKGIETNQKMNVNFQANKKNVPLSQGLSQGTPKSVKTGDMLTIFIFILFLAMAGSAGLFLCKRVQRKRL